MRGSTQTRANPSSTLISTVSEETPIQRLPKYTPTHPRRQFPIADRAPQALASSSLFVTTTFDAMAGLARDAAAFKSALYRQDYTSWHSQPPPLQQSQQAGPSTAVAGDADPSKKKKRPKSSTSFLLDPSACGVSHG